MGESKPLLLICTLSLSVIVHRSLGFWPHIQMPYIKVFGSATTEINQIGSTLTCDEQRNSLKDCATECFDRSSTNTGCPGFYVDGTLNGICYFYVMFLVEQKLLEIPSQVLVAMT